MKQTFTITKVEAEALLEMLPVWLNASRISHERASHLVIPPPTLRVLVNLLHDLINEIQKGK